MDCWRREDQLRTVVLTEKHEQARIAVRALGGRPEAPKNGCYLAPGYVVVWCMGHLYEFQTPDEIDSQWAGPWRTTRFPILPAPIPKRLADKSGTSRDAAARRQAKVLRDHVKKADRVILATDDDREGEAIGADALEFADNARPVLRLKWATVDPVAFKKGMEALVPWDRTKRRAEAAYARAALDWYFGMGPSRAATLTFNPEQETGLPPISIGRVQTATQGLVVARDLERERFQARDYFEVAANVVGHDLVLRYAPRGDDDPDKDQRLYQRDAADRIAKVADGYSGPLKVETAAKSKGPPLPYYMTTLQAMAANRWGWPADKTTRVADAVRLKGLVTYVRTSCPYLGDEEKAAAPGLLNALADVDELRGIDGLAEAAEAPILRPAVYNQKQVDAASHPGITPNANMLEGSGRFDLVKLSEDERKVFMAVVRRYVAAHLPDYEYETTTLSVDVPVDGRPKHFSAVGHRPLKAGWRIVEQGDQPDIEDQVPLPDIADGKAVTLDSAEVVVKQTKPKPAYTESSLLLAMEKAGLGTDATRAEILKTLRQRQYISASGKKIVSTPRGRAVIAALEQVVPELVSPALTARLEKLLDSVEKGDLQAKAVLEFAQERVGELTTKILQAEVDRSHFAVAPIGGTGRRARAPAKRARARPHGSAGRKTECAEADGKPTAKMVAFAEKLAGERKVALPAGYDANFSVCRAFLDRYAGTK